MITEFKGEYAFLSNFYHHPIFYNGILYQNNEAAFQAQKTLDESVRIQFANLPPNIAKRKGRTVKLRPDWEEVKYQIMHDICVEKFKNKELMQKLKDTWPKQLIEGNTWHDNYWGNCMCNKCKYKIGQNYLGHILQTIRAHNVTQPVYFE